VAHDDMPPDVGDVDRSVHQVRRQRPYVKPVPLAGSYAGLRWGLQPGAESMHVPEAMKRRGDKRSKSETE
jgi:hypothetical protein